MEHIVSKGIFSITRSHENESSSGIAIFTVDMPDGSRAEVSVDYSENTIHTVIKDIPVSDGFIDTIKDIFPPELRRVPDKYRDEVSSIPTNLITATRMVMSLIKYYLRHSSIPENLFAIKEMRWGQTVDSLYHLPTTVSISIEGMGSIQPLRKDSIESIQSALNSQIKPLVAMAYIHKAQAESGSRYKWIDATIAAELAIKEVLILKHPELEVLLLEMPSPPLSKLYGPILKKYLGEESPYRKQIDIGVQKRNHLVHKPNELDLDSQEASNYVIIVEAAIFHMLSKLYPNNLLVQSAYDRVILNIDNLPAKSLTVF